MTNNAFLVLPESPNPVKIYGQLCDLALSIGRLNFNGTNYLGLEVKYNHYLEEGNACEYVTEVTVKHRKFRLVHYRFNEDRLYLPTLMRWEDIDDMNGSASVLHCSARVVSYRIIAGDERRISDRAYHGMPTLREANTVNLTLKVGKYTLLVNKDYMMSVSGFFKEILENSNRHARHDHLLINETRDEAFVTLIDICHHRFWCKYEFKDDVLELAKMYQIPLARDFHAKFFRTDRELGLNCETPPPDVDHEFSLAKAVHEDTSYLLTRFPPS